MTCTAGVVWIDGHNNKRLLTAGHCSVALDGAVWRYDPNGSWGDYRGTLMGDQVVAHTDTRYGDIAEYSLNAPKSASASVYIDTAKTPTTKQTNIASLTVTVLPRTGLALCTSGAAHSLVCGWIINTKSVVTADIGGVKIAPVWGALHSGACSGYAGGGDSGAPVLANAPGNFPGFVGILSAGGDLTISGKSYCQMYFTSYVQITQAFGGHIATS